MRIRALRWLLLLTTFTVVIGVARSARADAPFCDPSATTAFAPPPLMPVADVRFEVDTGAWFTEWCRRVLALQITPAERDHVPKRLSPNATPASSDAGLLPSTSTVPRRHAATRVVLYSVRSKGPPGFHPSVYRPPR